MTSLTTPSIDPEVLDQIRILVTRNTRDFENCGLHLIDPFRKQ